MTDKLTRDEVFELLNKIDINHISKHSEAVSVKAMDRYDEYEKVLYCVQVEDYSITASIATQIKPDLFEVVGIFITKKAYNNFGFYDQDDHYFSHNRYIPYEGHFVHDIFLKLEESFNAQQERLAIDSVVSTASPSGVGRRL